MFWVDLSTSGLIEGRFNTASSSSMNATDITGTSIGNYIPSAKISDANYVYVFNTTSSSGTTYNPLPYNYFGIAAVTNIANATNAGKVYSNGTISVKQAYALDVKVDDGFPTTGRVTAVRLSNDPVWTTQGTNNGFDLITAGPPTSLTAVAASCFDNGGGSGSMQYSITTNNGNGGNCSLAIQFQ